MEQKYCNQQTLPTNTIFKLFPNFQICTDRSLFTSLDLWRHFIRMDVSTGALQNVYHKDEELKPGPK